MASAPQGIRVGRMRDMEGRDWHRWVRRALLGLLGLFVLLGLFNVFGQRPTSDTAHAKEASLKVYAPSRVRGGLLWEARFTIRANEDVKDAQLVLSQGWVEGNTLNTIEPSPLGEASRNGSLSLDLGHIPKGERYELYMQFQSNPTNVGHRSTDVELQDGDKVLLSIDRTLWIFP
jgi:hypothetical protein